MGCLNRFLFILTYLMQNFPLLISRSRWVCCKNTQLPFERNLYQHWRFFWVQVQNWLLWQWCLLQRFVPLNVWELLIIVLWLYTVLSEINVIEAICVYWYFDMKEFGLIKSNVNSTCVNHVLALISDSKVVVFDLKYDSFCSMYGSSCWMYGSFLTDTYWF